MKEIFEDDFDSYIGKDISTLKDISIYGWYPVVDSNRKIINFITAEWEDFYLDEGLNPEDYEIFDDDYAILKH